MISYIQQRKQSLKNDDYDDLNGDKNHDRETCYPNASFCIDFLYGIHMREIGDSLIFNILTHIRIESLGIICF